MAMVRVGDVLVSPSGKKWRVVEMLPQGRGVRLQRTEAVGRLMSGQHTEKSFWQVSGWKVIPR